MRRRIQRRTLLLGSLAAVAPARHVTAADAIALDQLDPYARPGRDLDRLVQTILLRPDGAKEAMSRLWNAWQQASDIRYAEWALSYGYVWWRKEPDRKQRERIATIGQRMASALLASKPSSVIGLTWRAAYDGAWALSRGVMESLHLVPKILETAARANDVDPTYMYGLATQLIARVYFKAPPFPVSRGNPKKSLVYLEKARPLAEGRFGPWYFFLTESLYINGRVAEAQRIMDTWERQIQPSNLIELFNIGLTQIDMANLQKVLADGSYDRYLWDAYLVPVSNDQILQVYQDIRRRYLKQ